MTKKNQTMSGQGSIVPTIFIGLGGTGSRIVDRIASRAEGLPNWEEQLRSLTSFITIDTNELDQHRLVHIPNGNRINIAAFDKVKAFEGFKRSKDRQLLGFLDLAYKPRAGSKPGAGQIRIESRFGFFYHSPEIRERMRQIVQAALVPGNTWRQSDIKKYYVYIFCTLAGGTGSGSFLSAAYLIDSIIAAQGWQPRIVGHMLLSTLMTPKVGPELHPDIHANTYAALKELEHMTKLGYQEEKDQGREEEEFVYWRDENSRDEPQKVTNRPFFLAFVHDSPAHITLPDVEAAIGDSAFLQIFTPIMAEAAGELDNYEKHQYDLTKFPGDMKNVGKGYSKNFGAMGAAAMILPGEDLLKYCSLRFAAQAIRSQITFGVDDSNPSDERARALARLAVNYADPKFQAMSPEAQEEEINKSFVKSVQEMARQDERDELLQGFWYKMVEGIDLGQKTGLDEKGEEVRGESLMDRVVRKLGEERGVLLNKVGIKEKAFIFLQEAVNQYVEVIDRLKSDVRAAKGLVDEGLPGLETAAVEGEAILELKLNPIGERYLILRMLDRCNNEWIPSAEAALEKVTRGGSVADLANSEDMERLAVEEYEILRDAAKAKRLGMLRDDEAFLAARDEAQIKYRNLIRKVQKALNAEIQMRQLRALRDYLVRRSNQYFQLSTKMDGLVSDLEEDAQALRRGERGGQAALALKVEVFETLEEPRRRIWDQVYKHLFLDGGRFISTFNREELAAAISEQLKPVVREDGRVVEKELDTLVHDIKQALIELGEARLGPAILGDDNSSGLDLVKGLDLEARLRLAGEGGELRSVSEDDVRAYETRKLRALQQLAGVLARVDAAEARAFDDNVKFPRTRLVVLGLSDGANNQAADAFKQRVMRVMEESGRQVKTTTWHNPRIAIVHDVELGIPLYYFKAVINDLEDPYLDVAADEGRTYHLHTDYHWEKSLPNLNPRRAEVAVSWALHSFTEGMICGLIYREGDAWIWLVDGVDGDEKEVLGDSLSGAMYRMGEIHRNKDMFAHFNRTLEKARAAKSDEEYEERRAALSESVEKFIVDLSRREMRGALRTDLLDRPLLRAILAEVQARPDDLGGGKGDPKAGPQGFSFK